MNGKKGNFGAVLGVLFLILVLYVLATTFFPTKVTPPSIEIELAKEKIKNGETTTAMVKVTNIENKKFEGHVELMPKQDQAQYITTATDEDKNILLASEGSSTTKVFKVTGHTNVEVKPVIVATLYDKDGNFATSAEVRITVTEG